MEVEALVRVSLPDERISPPVIVRPWDDARPAADIPPKKVEVAVELFVTASPKVTGPCKSVVP